MKKRLIAALLVVATLCGCVACGHKDNGPSVTTDDTSNETSHETLSETTPETTPAVDWNTWTPADGAGATELSVSGTMGDGNSNEPVLTTHTYGTGDKVFSLKEADATDARITLRASTVSAVRVSQAFEDGTVATYQAKVQTTEIKESNWNALYIGLRLSDVANDPTSQSGVWIAIMRDRIGMRVGKWPATEYISITDTGIDFSKERMLYVEDDMEKDTITVYADNDSGEKTCLAVYKIEDGYIRMYKPGSDSPVLNDAIEASIAATGCFSIWLHHTDTPTYVTDLTITGWEREKFTAQEANMWNSKDILTDTWISIDDEGRVAGTDNGVVNDRKVGIFYFLWHNGTSSQPIYNHAAAFEEGGADKLIETMQSGPLGFAHYWAEPYFGYYQSNDEWVIRKHTYQLNAAGVDFIFIDATNGLTYEKNYEAILKVWSEMRAEGHETPQIMFHCGNTTGLAESSLTALWNNLYSEGRYEDLWFKYEGKPLIFMPRTLWVRLPNEMKEFFTYRSSWAYTKDSAGSWYSDIKGRNCWPWADMYPQNAGCSSKGEVEQMIVMCGFWANGSFGTNGGRSYSQGVQPPSLGLEDFSFSLVSETSGKGLAFEEQFNYAIENDPGLIMITGWNEWWAGRWEAGAAIGQTIANTYTVTDGTDWTRHYFVDCFNPEYSRDIEPVKGYFNDNYYYQMVQNIREYKGSRQLLAAFGQRPIDMSGDLSQWDVVGPEYRDYTGDVTHRDHDSYVGQLHYTNTTGRNDFTVAKVSRYDGYVYFYAECANDITAAEGTNWMNLYINADADLTTGWNGYEYLINRTRDGETCSIQAFVDGEWKFEDVGTAAYRVSGNTIQIRVEADALGLGNTFDFKWADNSVDDGDIMQFLDLGDTAPDGRFNYRYTTEQKEIVMPEVMTDDLIVLKAGSYYAYVGGELVRLDEITTKATFFGDEAHLYLPLAFVQEVLGMTVDTAAPTYNHYGVTYIDAKAVLEACGKTISATEHMLVLGDRALTEDELETIYRAMY